MSVNQALAQVLERVAAMQELLGEEAFKAVSHARAARAVADLPCDIATIARDPAKLLEIPGIGKGIAGKITEFCTTGRMRLHDDLLTKVPPGLLGLLRVPGLGPKTIRLLWTDRGVTDAESLKRIIADGSILTVPRMGAKTVEKLRASLVFAETETERLPLGLALPIAERIAAHLRTIPGVTRAEHAGSLRRGRDTVGDIDILVTTSDPKAASEAFRAMPGVRQVLAAGDSKSSVRMAVNPDMGRWTDREEAARGPTIQVDLRVVPEASWGAALMYFTGSKEHNVRLRERAQRKGLTLNEYGLFPEDDEPTPPQSRGVRAVAGASEEEVYKALGVPCPPPELREDRGELALKETPRLLEVGDIRAELHAHTTASDGSMEIEELARSAKARGFHTIAVTDHSRSSGPAGGLQPDRLLLHVEAVRKAAAKVKGITILAGSEVDILADGRLDYDDDTLRHLDIVVTSPHHALSQEPEAATRRLLAAIRSPFVRILGHPTGRVINRRPGLAPDMARIIAAAKEHNVALEINAHWLRLDLRDAHVRQAVEAGCLIAVDCDVHAPEDFDNLRFGVLTARRGWLSPEQCINTWDAARLHAWLRR